MLCLSDWGDLCGYLSLVPMGIVVIFIFTNYMEEMIPVGVERLPNRIC